MVTKINTQHKFIDSGLSQSNKVAYSNTDEYLAFCDYLEETSGITLGANKTYLVKNRLRPILSAHGVETLADAMKKIKGGVDPKLNLEIIDAMTTNETSWFRDQYPFEYLRDELLPNLKGKRMVTPKIWSAACSHGHEAYSISMVIDEYTSKNPGAFPSDIQIVGTDISSRVIKSASTAEYDRLSIARGLSEERKKKYFTKADNENYKLISKIKNRVRFQYLNLLEHYSSIGKFDIIFCRNVLIYFSKENKSAIIEKFAKALNHDGVLILGASETVSNYSKAFEMVKCKRGVVYRHF
ncbi:MAG: chemotaxis protein CheR [marine bacterium B5-7]|nr:MAG: chemotaxis protein CheR [marine bacterium B5-7]